MIRLEASLAIHYLLLERAPLLAKSSFLRSSKDAIEDLLVKSFGFFFLD